MNKLGIENYISGEHLSESDGDMSSQGRMSSTIQKSYKEDLEEQSHLLSDYNAYQRVKKAKSERRSKSQRTYKYKARDTEQEEDRIDQDLQSKLSSIYKNN